MKECANSSGGCPQKNEITNTKCSVSIPPNPCLERETMERVQASVISAS